MVNLQLFHQLSRQVFHQVNLVVSLLDNRPHSQRTQHVAPMLGAHMAIIVAVTTSARPVLLVFGALMDRTRVNPAFLVPIP